ncbi:uncharacterized protein LOC144124528 isoform X1 [Amblyomma americanum]
MGSIVTSRQVWSRVGRSGGSGKHKVCFGCIARTWAHIESSKMSAHRSFEATRASFNEHLIDEVARRPLLWNVRSNDYRKNINKTVLWEEIRDAMRSIDPTATVESVQSRWRNLKDTYRRKLKDIEMERSGAGVLPKSRCWVHLERMRFLKDQMEARHGHSSMEVVNEDIDAHARPGSPAAADDFTPDASFEDIFLSPDLPQPTNSQPMALNEEQGSASQSVCVTAQNGPPQPKKRKRVQEELDAVNARLISVRSALLAHKPADADEHFLLSLKPYMETVPRNMRRHLQIEMLNILGHYSEGEYPPHLVVASPSQ